MTRLLLVDNDKAYCASLKPYLKAEGFELDISHQADHALKHINSHTYQLIILDIVLPDSNGLELLKSIRTTSDTPILLLTAKNDTIDKIIGLEIGADDFLTKPCHMRELIARIHAILRRGRPHPTEQRAKAPLSFDDIVLDSNKRTISLEGSPVELTNAEFNILELLIRSPGQAYSKEELTEQALNRKYTAFDRSIDVHISNLRKKFGSNKQNEVRIKTVRGFGYMYNAGDEAS